MARKVRYRIYCVTEGKNVSGFSLTEEPAAVCPNNPEHEVVVGSNSIEEVFALDNLGAATSPVVTDDIASGYAVGSRWINISTQTEYVCVDNAEGAAVWKSESGGGAGTGDIIWQVHKTRNGNNNMSNGTWFDCINGKYLTGSWSGYASSCTPLLLPYKAKVSKVFALFRVAAFDWRASAGDIFMTLEFRTMFYNGSSDGCELVLTLPGSFSGSSTPNDTYKFEIPTFEVSSGVNVFNKQDMVGVMLRKARSEPGYINSLRDPVLQIHFTETE